MTEHLNHGVSQLRDVWQEWRVRARSPHGPRYGFPLCCQAHYYLDVLRGRASASRRGAVMAGPIDCYVPCGICLRRPSRWRLPKVMEGPVELPLRYESWLEACAKYGIAPDVAARYVQ